MTFKTAVDSLVKFVDTSVIPLLFALGFIFFLIGLVRFFFLSPSEENREKGRQFALWGLVGFVVLFSIWGIVNLLVSTFQLSTVQGGDSPTSFAQADSSGTGWSASNGQAVGTVGPGTEKTADTAVSLSPTPAPMTTTSVTDVNGMYDVYVAGSVSLRDASTFITGIGGQVIDTFPTLYVLTARLTRSQEALVANSSAVDEIDPTIAAIAEQQSVCKLVTPAAPWLVSDKNTGKVKVAIVDYSGNGDVVLNTYNAQCEAIGPACTDGTTAYMVSALDSAGNFTGVSRAAAIIDAVNGGANVINLSSVTNNGGILTRVEKDALAIAAAHGTVIVTGAGNSPGFVNTLSLPNASGATVVTVGGLDPWDLSVPDSRYSSNADIFANDYGEGTSGGDGTSFAAPRVAAAIAADMATTGSLDPKAAVNDITAHCQKSSNGTDKTAPTGIAVPPQPTSEDPFYNSGYQSGNDQYKSQNRTQIGTIDTIEILPDGTRKVVHGDPEGFQNGITDDKGVVPQGAAEKEKNTSDVGPTPGLTEFTGAGKFANDLVGQIKSLGNDFGTLWVSWSSAIGGTMGNAGGFMSGLTWSDFGGFMSQTQAPKGN